MKERSPVISVVDDDAAARSSLRFLLKMSADSLAHLIHMALGAGVSRGEPVSAHHLS